MALSFKCNHSKKGDAAYFQGLGNHLERDDVARAFFEYLPEHIDVGPSCLLKHTSQGRTLLR